MRSLQDRLRFIMKRDRLTYRQVANIAEATEQAVYKWLKTGSMSERSARIIAENSIVDWLWLRHGITRIEPELLYDLVSQSASCSMIWDLNSYQILAAGEGLADMAGWVVDEAAGQSIVGQLTALQPETAEVFVKIAMSFNGWSEASLKIDPVDSGKGVWPIRFTSHFITTTREGCTYGLASAKPETCDGTENSLKSLSICIKKTAAVNQQAVQSVLDMVPDNKHLKALLLSEAV